MATPPTAPLVGRVGLADKGEREQAVDSMSSLGASVCQRPQCQGTARPEEQAGTVELMIYVILADEVDPREMGMGVACSLTAAL